VKKQWETEYINYGLGAAVPAASGTDVQPAAPPTTQAAGAPLLHLDLEKGLVWVGRQEIRKETNPQDFAVLLCLWKNQDGITTKDRIVREAWSEEASEGVSDQAIAAAIARLRRVLKEHAPGWEYIETVRSSRREQGGYRLHPRGIARENDQK
jgi:DNA-binding response OmpR family regulator